MCLLQPTPRLAYSRYASYYAISDKSVETAEPHATFYYVLGG